LVELDVSRRSEKAVEGSARWHLGKEAERMRSRLEQVERFEIWYQGEKIGEAEDLLKTEKLIEELEAKLKIHADQMVVKVIYQEGGGLE
jgi:O-methyltransferase involved in polyketide biosynthesis